MSELSYITKCTLCGYAFTLPGLPDGDVDPRNVPPEVLQMSMRLYEHLQKMAMAEQENVDKAQRYFKKHPDTAPPDLSKAKHLQAFREIAERMALAQGSATMWPFDSPDPNFRRLKHYARLRLNTITRKYGFTDEMLLDAVVQLNLHESNQAMVLTLVTAVRDALTEQGKYAPGAEADTMVSLV